MTIYYSQNDHNPHKKYRAVISFDGQRGCLNDEEIEENKLYEKYEKQYEQEQRRISDDQELIQNLREQTQASRTEIDSLQYELERTKVENQNSLNDKFGNIESEFERVTKESDEKLKRVIKESNEREDKLEKKLKKEKERQQKEKERHQKEIQQMHFDALSPEEKQRVLEAQEEREREARKLEQRRQRHMILDHGISEANKDIREKNEGQYVRSVFNAFRRYVFKQNEIKNRNYKRKQKEETLRQEIIRKADVLGDMYEQEERKKMYQASLEWDRKHEKIMRKLQEIEGLLELRIEENCRVEKWRAENKKIMREDIDRQNKNRVIISVIVLHILFIWFAFQGYQDLL